MRTIKEVEVFAVGTWNGMKFVGADLEEIADNTNALLSKKALRAPIKLGHSKTQILAQSDGQPALGWLDNFKVKGNKLLADLRDIPEILIKSIEGNLFKQVSIELKHEQNTGWFARGLAILGADLPAVKNLEDLQIYLSEKSLPDNINGDFILCFSDPHFDEIVMDNKTTELELKLKEKEIEFNEKVKQLDEEKKAFDKKKSELFFSEKKVEILPTFKELLTEGRLTPALFESITKEIDSHKANFSSEGEFAFSSKLVLDIIKSQEKKVELSDATVIEQPEATEEATESDFRIDEKIDSLVNEKVEKTGHSYLDCIELVLSENAELKEEYHKFQTEGE